MSECSNCHVTLVSSPCSVCGFAGRRPARWPNRHDPLTDSYIAPHGRRAVAFGGGRMIADRDTPTELRFRETCRAMLARGEKPTPVELNRRMGWNGYDDISGRFTKIRREELEAAGWRKDARTGRWAATTG